METGQLGHIGDAEAHVVSEQIQGVHNPVIIHILPKIPPRKTVDGLTQVALIGIKRIGQVLEGKGIHQERPPFGHIPAAPVIQQLIDRRHLVV